MVIGQIYILILVLIIMIIMEIIMEKLVTNPLIMAFLSDRL